MGLVDEEQGYVTRILFGGGVKSKTNHYCKKIAFSFHSDLKKMSMVG